jgi:hypothetical protein
VVSKLATSDACMDVRAAALTAVTPLVRCKNVEDVASQARGI